MLKKIRISFIEEEKYMCYIYIKIKVEVNKISYFAQAIPGKAING